MGWLYTSTMSGLIVFSVVAQLAAVPCFLAAQRAARRSRGS